MHNKLLFSSIAFVLTVTVGYKPVKSHFSTEPDRKIVSKLTGDVKWLTFEEAQKLSAKHPKKIFVDVYTDWCGWCKKMDKSTLRDPSIQQYLDKKYYSVKLNAESDAKLTYKGKEITERELAGKIFKATGYPTTVYLDENQNVLQPISSYLEVEALDKILHYFGEDYYKNTPWETFESIYSKGTK